MVINLHHFGEKIIDLLGEGSNYGLKISYSLEKELLGTGGGICNSIHHFDDPFIVLSSDTWTDFDFNKLRLKEGHLAHMIMIPNPKNNAPGDAALIDGLINLESDIHKYTFSVFFYFQEVAIEYASPPFVSHDLVRGWIVPNANVIFCTILPRFFFHC